MRYFIFYMFLGISLFSASQNKYIPEKKQVFKTYIKEAKRAKELDIKKADRIYEIVSEMDGSSTDPNEVYNLGRAIQEALQPGFKLQGHTFTNAALQLMIQSELAYRYAITNCECHGRANIMLGMLYNQQNKYSFSEPYLEKGLKLDEGSDDWMIAANQYLLAGAYTSKTKVQKYINVYKKFKVHAQTHTNPYYKKMANLYIPYYE